MFEVTTRLFEALSVPCCLPGKTEQYVVSNVALPIEWIGQNKSTTWPHRKVPCLPHVRGYLKDDFSLVGTGQMPCSWEKGYQVKGPKAGPSRDSRYLVTRPHAAIPYPAR